MQGPQSERPQSAHLIQCTPLLLHSEGPRKWDTGGGGGCPNGWQISNLHRTGETNPPSNRGSAGSPLNIGKTLKDLIPHQKTPQTDQNPWGVKGPGGIWLFHRIPRVGWAPKTCPGSRPDPPCDLAVGHLWTVVIYRIQKRKTLPINICTLSIYIYCLN